MMRIVPEWATGSHSCIPPHEGGREWTSSTRDSIAGTATFGEGDYATTSGASPSNIAVNFSSGETSETVVIDILSDGQADSGETFRAIVQRNSSDAASVFLAQSTTVTINDAVAQATTYSLSASPSTVVEGNQVTFTITRSGDKPAETIYFSTLSDGTATFAEGDYATTSGASPSNIAVTFSSGTTSRTVTLNILNDGTSDSGEQFRAIVQRNASDPTTTYLDRSGFVTINDAQGTTYSLTASPTTVTEGNQVTFTITRSGDKPAETVYFSTLSDGTATFGEGDYTTLSGGAPSNIALSFSSGETSETVTLNIVNDGVADSGEQFRAIVQRNSSDAVTTYLDRSGFVTINDAPPQQTSYSLSASPSTVVEGNQVTFTITRSGDKPAETIYFSTLADGTATYAEGDYRTTAGGAPANVPIVFGATESTKTVTLNIVSDGVADSGEQFRAIVQRSTADPVSTFLSRSGFVTINDAAQTGTSYTLVPASLSAAEGTQISFTITRSGNLPSETIYFSTLADGTATYAEGDYEKVGGGAPLNIPVVFSAGDTSETVTLNILADAPDAMEQFRAIIQRSSSDPVTTYLSRSDYVAITEGAIPPPPATGDDFADSDEDTTAPIGMLQVDEPKTGIINGADANDTYGDKDVFAISLTAGQVYDIRLQSTATGGAPALPSGIFSIRNGSFVRIEDSGSGADVHKYYQAEYTGLHYIRVGTGGSASQTGGYTLTVKHAPPPSTIPDDWADDPSDAGTGGSVFPGGNAAGLIESVGDKDYFAVTLQAGRVYTFSVAAEARGANGPIDTVALSLRGPGSFTATALHLEDGAGRTSFSYEITASGVYYLRVGAGDDGGDTGAYRVSVSAARLPPPPLPPLPPPNPALAPLEELEVFLDIAWKNGLSRAIELFTDDDFWSSLRLILKRFGYADNLAASNIIAHKLSYLSPAADFTKAWVSINKEVAAGGDFVEAVQIELTDYLIGVAIDYLSKYAVPAGFATFGVVGGMIGVLIASGGASWVYDRWGSDWVKDRLDILIDGVNDYPHYSSSSSAFSSLGSASFSSLESTAFSSLEASSTLGEDAPALPLFDEAFYRATYPEVDAAIAQGTVGSAYAHFLTLGVDLGYKPNSGQTLTRADLAISIVNNDPAALGNTALFTQALGALAGDGVGAAENAVANVLAAATGPANNAALDATLSALAHRKALDLVVNGPVDPIAAALAATGSAWASAWSDTSDFNQVFGGNLATVLQEGGNGYRLFVVASVTGSPADVLARLQAQEGWTPGGFDTFGIAEYGGLWVVIVADRSAGYGVVSPGPDTLDRITVYGDGAANDLYAGTRAANLFGLDGDDILRGGIGIDRLAGGVGDDRYVVERAEDLVIEAAGQGYDAVFSPVTYALAAGSEVEAISTMDRAGTQAIDFTGNEFGNNLFGNAGANRLSGGAGNDWLDGGPGDDRLDGGADVDTASYADAGSAVTVSLALGGAAQNTGGGGTDTLVDVENLIGSAFGDTLIGNGFANLLDGRAGADTMRGGAGDDTYYVDNAGDVVDEMAGEGIDTIYTTLAVYSLLGTQIERLGAASDVAHDFRGSTGNNGISGGAGNDFFRLQDGGVDAAAGGAGNDVFLFGSTLTSADSADGGAGNDQLAIQGDYAATKALTLGSGIVGIESFAILPGNDIRFGDPGTSFYDYNITTVDANVAAGARLTVDANRLRAGEDLTFNGSAETDGGFFIWGGGGVDTLTAGSKTDVFYFGENLQFGASDVVNGGGGIDQLGLRGSYTIVFGAGQLIGIENIGLVSAQDTRFGALGTTYNYNLTMNDSNLASGVQMTVDGTSLRGGETLAFNGSAETNGSFRIFGGQGNDTIVTGAGNDILQANAGADTMTGGGGADTFRYLTAGDSTAASMDHILDFAPGTDKIDLSRIDANSLVGGDQAFRWIGSAAFTGGGAGGAGELRAVLSSGHWLVQGDTNGDGAADFVIDVTTPAALGAGDFLL
jgi:Ca2+-binding RTX toxin-like protein